MQNCETPYAYARIPAHIKDNFMRKPHTHYAYIHNTGCAHLCAHQFCRLLQLQQFAKEKQSLRRSSSGSCRCIAGAYSGRAPAGTVKPPSVWGELLLTVLPLAVRLGKHACQAASCIDRCVSALLPCVETKAEEIMSSSQETLQEIH